MSFQGGNGIPFQWGPDGRHQYAECFIRVTASSSSGQYSTFQLGPVATGRIAYIAIVDAVAGTSALNIYMKKLTSAFTFNAVDTAVTIPSYAQYGSYDVTSPLKFGTSTTRLSSDSVNSIKTKVAESDSSAEHAYPIIVPAGFYFIGQQDLANSAQDFTLRWYERPVPA